MKPVGTHWIGMILKILLPTITTPPPTPAAPHFFSFEMVTSLLFMEEVWIRMEESVPCRMRKPGDGAVRLSACLQLSVSNSFRLWIFWPPLPPAVNPDHLTPPRRSFLTAFPPLSSAVRPKRGLSFHLWSTFHPSLRRSVTPLPVHPGHRETFARRLTMQCEPRPPNIYVNLIPTMFI